MDRLTRHELKQDELQDVLDSLERFGREHYREIVSVTAGAIIIIGLVFGLRTYSGRKESAANAALEEALETFNAYVGNAPPGSLAPSDQSYATAQEKYQKALSAFLAVTQKYPRTKAGAYARIHAGLCQAQLGNDAAAVKILTETARSSDPQVASLARFTLAGELARSGKTDQAATNYQDLADHPTLTVPKATALMGLAGLYRQKQPARARQIYEQIQKEFGSDQVLASAIKQQIGSLPE